MSISDAYAAPEQMDTSTDPGPDLDLDLVEEEEEEIARVVAEVCDQAMTEEVTAVFSGQNPSVVEQYLRYAQGTAAAGQGRGQEEEEGFRHPAAQPEVLQNPDKYAWELAAELRDEIWQDFVDVLGGGQYLADESDTELQATVAAARKALLRQAYDNVVAEQYLLKNGSQER